jgi:magnesium-transporting ATPase (P-type)
MIGAVTLNTTPLNAIQMLWVNLIMDSMASLAEATEPPEESLLKRKPYKRDESLVTSTMIRNIVSVAIYQIAVLLFIMFKGNMIFDIPVMMGTVNMSSVVGYHPELLKHGTLFFNTFVFMQQFNEINARKINYWEINVFEHFCNNELFIIIQVITTVTQILIVQYGGIYVRVCPLSVREHILCIAIGATVLLAMLISKLLLPHKIACNSSGIQVGRCKYNWDYEELV